MYLVRRSCFTNHESPFDDLQKTKTSTQTLSLSGKENPQQVSDDPRQRSAAQSAHISVCVAQHNSRWRLEPAPQSRVPLWMCQATPKFIFQNIEAAVRVCQERNFNVALCKFSLQSDTPNLQVLPQDSGPRC